MPRNGAIVLENQALISAAVIGAQATLGDAGFRQRDVRFFIELFSNWLQSTTGNWTLNIHNVQVQRYLAVLPNAGWAKSVGKQPPRYRLTPEGLLELLRRLGRRENLMRLDEFFLIFHIFDAYGDRLRTMLSQSGHFASRSLALDVDELLDPKSLVRRERAMVAREEQRLALRMEESRKMSDLTRQLLGDGKPLSDVIGVVQQRFPYELNSQKPLSELLAGFPGPFRRFELEQAAKRRADGLWGPTRELLLAYDRILQGLLDNLGK